MSLGVESGGSIGWQSIGCTDGSDKNTSKQEGCLQHDAEQNIRPRIPENPDQGGHPCLIPFQSIEVRSDVASNTGSTLCLDELSAHSHSLKFMLKLLR